MHVSSSTNMYYHQTRSSNSLQAPCIEGYEMVTTYPMIKWCERNSAYKYVMLCFKVCYVLKYVMF